MVQLEARLWGAGVSIQFPYIPVRPASASFASQRSQRGQQDVPGMLM